MNKKQQQPRDNGKAFDKKKQKILMISVTACAALILLAVIAGYTGLFDMVGGLFVPSGSVQTGTLPLEDGLDELEDIPEGEIRFRINKTVTFRTGRGLGDIMLENPKACEYDLEFSFSLQDGRIIYEAPLLKPGEYLYRDKLKKRLPEGVYDCTYKVRAYEPSGVLAGETYGRLTITVES